jgi:hypothetical protein
VKAKTQLIDASAALYYEVLVLEATAKALSSQTVDDPLQARAVIESFLIHSRNLIDFMYPTKPEKDDILAQDFFLDPGDWLRQREAEGAILQTSKRRINKLLSHLTYTRLKTSSEDSKWDSVGLRDEIVLKLRVFLKHVSGDLIDERLRNLLEKMADETIRR